MFEFLVWVSWGPGSVGERNSLVFSAVRQASLELSVCVFLLRVSWGPGNLRGTKLSCFFRGLVSGQKNMEKETGRAGATVPQPEFQDLEDEVDEYLSGQYDLFTGGLAPTIALPQIPVAPCSPRSKLKAKPPSTSPWSPVQPVEHAAEDEVRGPAVSAGAGEVPENECDQARALRDPTPTRSWKSPSLYSSSVQSRERDELLSSEEEKDETILVQSMSSQRSAAIVEAMLLATTSAPVRMPLPWENGTWLSSIFSHAEPVWMPPVPVQVPLDSRRVEPEAVQEVKVPARKLGVGPRRAPKPWAEEKSKSRQAALQLWVLVMEGYGEFCSLGRYLARAEPHEKMAILQDTFEDKATSTIRGRGYSMMQYRHWAEKSSVRVFPITESKVYQFFCYSRSLGVAATRLTRFREALAFCVYTIGLDLSEEVLKSRRIAGAALSLKKTKRPRVQRPPLTVNHVLWLEGYVCSQPVGFDLIFAGFLLFMLHCRCRFSDAMHVEAEPYIKGSWMESGTSEFKTKKAKGRRDSELPLVGCSLGLSQRPWAQKWLEARKELGLSARRGQPFMPVMLGTGVWTSAALSNHEANEYIVELFCQAPSGLDGVGTHSFKTTILSWLAKANVPPESRKLLGGHIVAGDITMHTYGRDALSGPLREMEDVLLDIFEDRFRPDHDRSGMYVKRIRPDQRERHRAPELKSDSNETYSSSSSSSSESDPGQEKVAILLHPIEKNLVQAKTPEPLWQHKTRFTFHRLGSAGSGSFACGRAVTAAFQECGILPKVLTPRCTVCFQGESFAFL